MQDASLEPTLNSLRERLSVEIMNDSRQIEFLRKRVEKNQALLNAVKNSLGAMNPEANLGSYGARAELVKQAIARVPKPQFTQDDVQAAIHAIDPSVEVSRDRLRSTLWTLSSNNRGIRLVSKGNNQQPAVYERVGGIQRIKRTTEEDKGETLKAHDGHEVPSLSPSSLEVSVREKTGRIEDLARRFNTGAEAIKRMLDPISKVYVGDRGWLKIREE